MSATKDKWNDLDEEAIANLNSSQVRRFFLNRDRLRAEGHKWEDDAEMILRGFIWDESEEEADESFK